MVVVIVMWNGVVGERRGGSGGGSGSGREAAQSCITALVSRT